jgi:sulfatase modifying factor 1
VQGGSPEVTAPAHFSTVSAYMLDKYAVTVGRFRKFVTAYVNNTTSAPPDGAGAHPAIAGTGWQAAWNVSLPSTQAVFVDTAHLACDSTAQTWTASPGTAAQENRAINCVDWYEAFAFCIWDGGRLATESEREYAAAGGAENRFYPWGSAVPDCTYANFYNGFFCSGGTGSVAPVGATPNGNGKWSHADFGGNVWTWCFDWYAAYSATAVTDYANITPGSARVRRGGNFGNGATYMRAADRNNGAPGTRNSGIGVRCARTAQ